MRLPSPLGVYRRLAAERSADARQEFPAGHYYSPVPSLVEVRAHAEQIWRPRHDLPGIDLRSAEQLALVREAAPLAAEAPFVADPESAMRYRYPNQMFGAGDALALYSVLRVHRPARVVEVGCGHSSALLLDVNERHFNGALELTFIEPFPERLHSLLRPGDRCRILEQGLQDVDPSVFAELTAGDVLFIDSSHVSRVGSDVNELMLEVLPSLPAGVLVHVHDITFPFEYPREYVLGGRAWNEAYLLRAFLSGNDVFRILWWNSFLATHHRDEVSTLLPDAWASDPGSSIWLQKLR